MCRQQHPLDSLTLSSSSLFVNFYTLPWKQVLIAICWHHQSSVWRTHITWSSLWFMHQVTPTTPCDILKHPEQIPDICFCIICLSFVHSFALKRVLHDKHLVEWCHRDLVCNYIFWLITGARYLPSQWLIPWKFDGLPRLELPNQRMA